MGESNPNPLYVVFEKEKEKKSEIWDLKTNLEIKGIVGN